MSNSTNKAEFFWWLLVVLLVNFWLSRLSSNTEKNRATAIEKTAIEKLEEAIAEERDSIGDINRHTACKEKVDEALAELEAELDELHDIIDSYDDPGPDPDP